MSVLSPRARPCLVFNRSHFVLQYKDSLACFHIDNILESKLLPLPRTLQSVGLVTKSRIHPRNARNLSVLEGLKIVAS